MPKFTHPDAPGVTAEVAPDHVAAYQSQGWVEQSDEPTPAPKKAADKPKGE